MLLPIHGKVVVHLLDDGLRPVCIVPHRLANFSISKQDNDIIAAGPVYALRDCTVVLSHDDVAGFGETRIGTERALTYVFGPVYLNSVPSFVPEAGTQNGMVVPAGGT